MSDVNIEKESQKVADLARSGQGCSMWDEIQNMTPNERFAIFQNVQAQSQNPNLNELRVLPGMTTDISHSGMGLSVKESLVDAKGNSTEILDFKNPLLPQWDTHNCVNLPKVGNIKVAQDK